MVMIVWLRLAGASLGGAAVIVLLLLAVYMIATRIIAETGLVHIQLLFSILRPWTMAANPGVTPDPVSMKTYFLGSMLETVHHSHREDVPVYASHAVKVADSTIFGPDDDADSPHDRRAGRGFIALLMLALLIGYVASFGSMLWSEYHHAWTKDMSATMPINDYGATLSKPAVLDSTIAFEQANYQSVHNPTAHFAFGFVFTGFLAVMRLMYTGWLLHPIGYLMLETFPGVHLWFSIFVGWLIKSLIVRLGGAQLYIAAKPLFLGLIVGESLAAGFWLIVAIVLSAFGIPYHPVHIMPG
jgi:hypothetical protein